MMMFDTKQNETKIKKVENTHYKGNEIYNIYICIHRYINSIFKINDVKKSLQKPKRQYNFPFAAKYKQKTTLLLS